MHVSVEATCSSDHCCPKYDRAIAARVENRCLAPAKPGFPGWGCPSELQPPVQIPRRPVWDGLARVGIGSPAYGARITASCPDLRIRHRLSKSAQVQRKLFSLGDQGRRAEGILQPLAQIPVGEQVQA